MPSHPDRVRRSYEWRWWDPEDVRAPSWRRPSDTSAETLARQSIERERMRVIIRDEEAALGITANVIEGDHH